LLDSFFLSTHINSDRGVAEVNRLCAGGGKPNLNSGELKRYRLLAPPLPEQKKIAKILSTWDKAITTTEQLLANSQQQKKALMQQLLTGKQRLLDQNGERFKGEWPTLSLTQCLLGSNLRNKDCALPSADIFSVTNSVGMIPMKEQVKGESLDRYKIVKNGWFAYNPMRINVGSIAQWRGADDCLVSPDYVVFKTDSTRLLPAFFDYFRQSHRWEDFMKKAGSGSVRVRIYLKDLSTLNVDLPTLEEQQKIAAVLSAADQEITSLQQQLDHLKQEKKALMQQLLTGKRRVKVEPA
jgi:type I restriction enzyme, S subunit